MINVDALAASALLTQFNTNSVYHDTLPDAGEYPMVVYTDLSETPDLHADNALYGMQHIIRVTIVTCENASINELKAKVMSCMTAAGFMWQNTNKTRNDNEYYTTLDFSIGILNN